MPRAFTAKTIENLTADPAKRQEIPDPALSGLYLVVQPSGVKSWAVRYRHAGKPRKMTLGKWPILSLADARVAASNALEAVEHGRDPGREKLAAKKARDTVADRDTMEALVDTYAKRHLSKLKSGGTPKRELECHAVEAWRGGGVG
ncbi:MAG: Arm DNA-binding domain-containing protein [Paracoccaceae bacterium]|nr:Arm DNA-binding domain-containing protein [Paracoccaceae bacterium]